MNRKVKKVLIHPSPFSPGWPKAMSRSHLGSGVLEMPN
jgi:hypothetical protein